MISQEDNLLIQGYFTVSLLTELKNNNFLESEYYKHMSFGDKYIKNNFKQIGIDNQGALLSCLYSLLVVPRQLLADKFPQEFTNLNIWLKKITPTTISTYKYDIPNIDYLRHIRNAVAHARIEFTPTKTVTFIDEQEDKKGIINAECSITIPLNEVGQLLTNLQGIFLKYVQSLQTPP